VSILAHRAAWAITHGRWPIGVDHINGDRSDNRLENLREADQQTNLRNASLSERNVARRIGVGWCARRQKWRARIKTDCADKHLGYFDDIDEAISARAIAERELGFHLNHGRVPPLRAKN
jgi:hypothetical protein